MIELLAGLAMGWLTYSFLSLPLLETMKSVPERIVVEAGPEAVAPAREILVMTEERPRQVAVSHFCACLGQLSPNHASS